MLDSFYNILNVIILVACSFSFQTERLVIFIIIVILIVLSIVFNIAMLDNIYFCLRV